MRISLILISLSLLWSCQKTKDQGTTTSSGSTQSKSSSTFRPMDWKSTAMDAQEALFKTKDERRVKYYFKEDYIQHNPYIKTGLQPVLDLLPQLKEADVTARTHRMLQDGNFIIMHNTYNNADMFGAPKVVTFDIWRMEDGKVAEHWDAISPDVGRGISGRTQVDGANAIIDLDKTDANKALVKKFVDDILFGKAPEKITDYIQVDYYNQHNPMVGDGFEGLQKAVKELTEAGDMFTYKKVHNIWGEGNFILTQSEGEWHGKRQAFYDLFRLKDGKIVEHWDVIQEIPEKMAHSNGMF